MVEGFSTHGLSSFLVLHGDFHVNTYVFCHYSSEANNVMSKLEEDVRSVT